MPHVLSFARVCVCVCASMWQAAARQEVCVMLVSPQTGAAPNETAVWCHVVFGLVSNYGFWALRSGSGFKVLVSCGWGAKAKCAVRITSRCLGVVSVLASFLCLGFWAVFVWQLVCQCVALRYFKVSVRLLLADTSVLGWCSWISLSDCRCQIHTCWVANGWCTFCLALGSGFGALCLLLHQDRSWAAVGFDFATLKYDPQYICGQAQWPETAVAL